MSAYISRLITHQVQDQESIVIGNRWNAPGACSFQIETGTWDLQVTLARLNDPDDTSPPVGNLFTVVTPGGAVATSDALAAGFYTANISSMAAEAFVFTNTNAGAGQMRFLCSGTTGG